MHQLCGVRPTRPLSIQRVCAGCIVLIQENVSVEQRKRKQWKRRANAKDDRREICLSEMLTNTSVWKFGARSSYH